MEHVILYRAIIKKILCLHAYFIGKTKLIVLFLNAVQCCSPRAPLCLTWCYITVIVTDFIS